MVVELYKFKNIRMRNVSKTALKLLNEQPRNKKPDLKVVPNDKPKSETTRVERSSNNVDE